MTKDPVCGKEVDPLRARAVGIFGGTTYYFCSQECKARFTDPRKAPREPTRDLVAKPEKRNTPAPATAAVAAKAPPSIDTGPLPGATAPSPSPSSSPSPSPSKEPTDSLQFKNEPPPEVLDEYAAGEPEAKSWARIWAVVIVVLAAAGAVAFFVLKG
jgi:YHS domain-containing protein